MNRIDIYKGWCKNCSICASFCPRYVLEMDANIGYPVVKDIDSCNGCKLCEWRCPDFAITVHRGDKVDTATDSSPVRTGARIEAAGATSRE